MWVEAPLHGHYWRNARPDRRALGDRFELGTLVSEGTTASVYRGWDSVARQPAAIKILREHALDDPCSIARFEAEAMLAGRLAHPNLLPAVGSGRTEAGRPWFATAWASRGSLADQMVKRGRLRADEAVRVAVHVLRCLDYVHGLGIVHRDVQPENILVSDDDVVLLSDFGLALTPDRPRWVSNGAPPSFPPPEERDIASLGEVTDLFGVGATLFVLLTGQSPVALLVDRVRASALAALPDDLGRVVDRATRSCPRERFPTARAMAAELVGLGGTVS
jgi:eukaryotic-like serine/threonine-protein kinase